jgi:hypothetical protein
MLSLFYTLSGHCCTCIRILGLHQSSPGNGSQHRNYYFKSLWSLQKTHIMWQLPTVVVTSLHLRRSVFTEPLLRSSLHNTRCSTVACLTVCCLASDLHVTININPAWCFTTTYRQFIYIYMNTWICNEFEFQSLKCSQSTVKLSLSLGMITNRSALMAIWLGVLILQSLKIRSYIMCDHSQGHFSFNCRQLPNLHSKYHCIWCL